MCCNQRGALTVNDTRYLSSLVLILVSAIILEGCNTPDITSSGGFPRPDLIPVVDTAPKWCPTDSMLVAFTHYAQTLDEESRIGYMTTWIVHIGSGQIDLITQGFVADWFPDGETLLLYLGSQLWSFDLASGDRTKLSDSEWPCLQADVCPCGTKLAYVVDEGPYRGIWTMDLGRLVPRWVYHGFAPDWHPDGAKIICDGLTVIDENGNWLRDLPWSGWPERPVYPAWSPDGQMIAFGAHVDGAAIWIMSEDGTGTRAVTPSGALPSWAPTGRQLAFADVSEDSLGTAIWIVDIMDLIRTQVTFPEAYSDSAW